MSENRQISDNTPALGGGVGHVDDSFLEGHERVRKALKADLAGCGLSREEVALRLSNRVGRVSLAMLDAYVAETKAHRFPAELIPAWVSVTGSRRLLDLLCGEVGLSIATSEDRDFAELGRAQMTGERLRAKLAGRV